MTKTINRVGDAVGKALDAATSLFKEKGFTATTVREIANAAGMLPGSLHYRFGSKEAILLAAAERAVNRAIDAVRQAADASRDPVERVRLALRAHMSVLLSGDDGVYVLLYDWRSVTGEAREALLRLRDKYEAYWDGLLYEAAGAGRLRPRVDLKLVRMLGFGAMNWAAQWFSREGERSPEEVADAFWAYMAFGILADDRRPADLTATLQSLSALELLPAEGPEPVRTRK